MDITRIVYSKVEQRKESIAIPINGHYKDYGLENMTCKESTMEQWKLQGLHSGK
jgi:hypothetical protein